MADDPFTLLGLPRAFDIDQRALQAAYLRRAAALHPDRVGGDGAADPIAQAEAQRTSAALNDARTVLADDEQRANLLLSLLGGPAKEQDKSLPDNFLIDMMDVRQEMESALASEDLLERERMEAWARDRRAQHVDSVRSGFAAMGEHPSPAALANIRRELNAWRYIERMLEQLHDARA